MTEITLEDIRGWREVHAEAHAIGYPQDDASLSFTALLDAAERSLSEQSRIDAAVAKERERCEQETRRYAGFYPPHSDGRNTFVMLADFIAAGRTPTPTTEEGA